MLVRTTQCRRLGVAPARLPILIYVESPCPCSFAGVGTGRGNCSTSVPLHWPNRRRPRRATTYVASSTMGNYDVRREPPAASASAVCQERAEQSEALGKWCANWFAMGHKASNSLTKLSESNLKTYESVCNCPRVLGLMAKVSLKGRELQQQAPGWKICLRLRNVHRNVPRAY